MVTAVEGGEGYAAAQAGVVETCSAALMHRNNNNNNNSPPPPSSHIDPRPQQPHDPAAYMELFAHASTFDMLGESDQFSLHSGTDRGGYNSTSPTTMVVKDTRQHGTPIVAGSHHLMHHHQSHRQQQHPAPPEHDDLAIPTLHTNATAEGSSSSHSSSDCFSLGDLSPIKLVYHKNGTMSEALPHHNHHNHQHHNSEMSAVEYVLGRMNSNSPLTPEPMMMMTTMMPVPTPPQQEQQHQQQHPPPPPPEQPEQPQPHHYHHQPELQHDELIMMDHHPTADATDNTEPSSPLFSDPFEVLRAVQPVFKRCKYLLPCLASIPDPVCPVHISTTCGPIRQYNRRGGNHNSMSPIELEIASRRVETAICAFGGSLNHHTTKTQRDVSSSSTHAHDSTLSHSSISSSLISPSSCTASSPKSIFRLRSNSTGEDHDARIVQLQQQQKRRNDYKQSLPERYHLSGSVISWEVEEDPPVAIFSSQQEGEFPSAATMTGDSDIYCREVTSTTTRAAVAAAASNASDGSYASSLEDCESPLGGMSSGDRHEFQLLNNSDNNIHNSKMKYRCKLCGQLKQNHACPYRHAMYRSIGVMVYPAVNSYTAEEPGTVALPLTQMNNFVSYDYSLQHSSFSSEHESTAIDPSSCLVTTHPPSTGTAVATAASSSYTARPQQPPPPSLVTPASIVTTQSTSSPCFHSPQSSLSHDHSDEGGKTLSSSISVRLRRKLDESRDEDEEPPHEYDDCGHASRRQKRTTLPSLHPSAPDLHPHGHRRPPFSPPPPPPPPARSSTGVFAASVILRPEHFRAITLQPSSTTIATTTTTTAATAAANGMATETQHGGPLSSSQQTLMHHTAFRANRTSRTSSSSSSSSNGKEAATAAAAAAWLYQYPVIPLTFAERKRLSDSLFYLSRALPDGRTVTTDCAHHLRDARRRNEWDLAVAELLTQIVVALYCGEGDACLDGLQQYLLHLGIAC